MTRPPMRPSAVAAAAGRAWTAAVGLAAVGLAAAGLAACASSGAAGGGAPPAGRAPGSDAPIRNPAAGTMQVTRIDGATGTFEIASLVDAPIIDAQPVAARADKAFAALLEAYESRGITVNLVHSEARILGARDARVSRRLGKSPLSRYIDCGRDAMASPVADSYLVTLTAVTRVKPTEGEHSTLLTQVLATARSVNTSGTVIRCGSTGRLEREINTAAALAALK